MSKATYLLISWNNGNIMLIPTQKEPSWSFVLYFLIYFPRFSFSACCKHVFIWNENLYHYIIIPFDKPYFNLQGKCHGRISGVCILLKHFTMPWSHCNLSSYFVFKCGTSSNKRDRNIVTESEVFLNKQALSTSLLFEDDNHFSHETV